MLQGLFSVEEAWSIYSPGHYHLSSVKTKTWFNSLLYILCLVIEAYNKIFVEWMTVLVVPNTTPRSPNSLEGLMGLWSCTPMIMVSNSERLQSKISIGKKCMVWSMKEKRRKSPCPGASLVVQWLRICLPMQGTRVRALVWEDPTCHGATRPVSHNYWACTSGACAPQQERPR